MTITQIQSTPLIQTTNQTPTTKTPEAKAPATQTPSMGSDFAEIKAQMGPLEELVRFAGAKFLGGTIGTIAGGAGGGLMVASMATDGGTKIIGGALGALGGAAVGGTIGTVSGAVGLGSHVSCCG